MNKSKLILTLGLSGIILGVYCLYTCCGKNEESREIILGCDEACRSFLSENGLNATEKPPESVEIVLPSDDSSFIYGAYCTLQREQHLPVSDYFGKEATVYTYALDTSPTARAELVCSKDGLLLGAMYYDRTSFQSMYAVIT